MRCVVAVDLGGTKTAGAVVTDDGTIRARASIPTASRVGGAVILDATTALVRDLLALAAGLGDEVVAVGVGSAGVIDARTGEVVSATDAIRGWAGTHLGGELRVRLGLPVAVDNDVHAHALGEAWLGACAGRGSALVVAAGTGVGGSFLLDGRPLHGAHHVAGHVGHVSVPEADGVPCTCGSVGHVEAVASGPGLHAVYLALGGASEAATARDVVARAAAGDGIALAAVDRAATALGRAVGGLVNVLDPEVVVVGGGLAGAGPLWWSAMERAVRAELIGLIADVPVVEATLGSDAALVGAARLAWRHLADLSSSDLAAPSCPTDPSDLQGAGADERTPSL